MSFLPTIMTHSVTDLTPALLLRRGIRLLMLDFDNTLVPYTTNEPTKEVKYWIALMKRSGIKLCVVSNSKNQRVMDFCRRFELDCITKARKPFPKGIRQCLERYGITASECALVGDQIYTDTLGATSCGVQAILVDAIHNHNIWLKLRHVAEMPFILAARKRRL